MAAAANGKDGKSGNDGHLGFEADLFLAADKLRKNLEPTDYKLVVLGLIFLRHISLAFEAKREELLADEPEAAEDADEYVAENVFWVPKEARWSHQQANARQPTIGKLIDDAMLTIEAQRSGSSRFSRLSVAPSAEWGEGGMTRTKLGKPPPDSTEAYNPLYHREVQVFIFSGGGTLLENKPNHN